MKGNLIFLKECDFNSSTLISNEYISPIQHEDVLRVFNSLIINSEEENHTRIFVEGARKRYWDPKFIYKNAPNSEEKLEKWLNRVFGQKKFGIVINRVEKWDEEIIQKLRPIMLCLQERFPSPLYNYELTLFLGNYRFTPFGIHKDDEYERTIHFNLGPNCREFLTWDDNVFKNKGLFINSQYPHLHVGQCTERYVVKPNDIFILDSRKNHIAGNLGFSVSLAIAVQKTSKTSIVTHFIKEIKTTLNENLHVENDSEFKNSTAKDKHYRKLRQSIANFRIETHDKSLLHFDISDYELIHKSNNGYITPPVQKYFSLIQGKFKRVGGFKIYYKKNKSYLFLYIRGRRASMNFYPEILTLIQEINKSNAEESTATLARKCNVPIEFLKDFINLLQSLMIVKGTD